MFAKEIRNMSKEELMEELNKLRGERKTSYTQTPKLKTRKKQKTILDDLPDDVVAQLFKEIIGGEEND